ncbi:DmsC/YnfH family molybdoenzyme membrane anchor subunit, partial [candidate division KSB1 bacterium]
MKQSFLFDLNKCTGCHACQLACMIENDLDHGMNWRHIYTFNEQRHPKHAYFHLSLACNHCEDAPCMKYCPAGAYSSDANTGAVTIDPYLCIGCKYCSWVCPYDAPKYSKSKGIVEKCTMCSDRLNDNLDPACVSLCPTGALGFGEKPENPTQHVQGFTVSDIKPSIDFTPLREERVLPEGTTAPHDKVIVRQFHAEAFEPESKISVVSEWSLILFSVMVSTLFGLFIASMMSALRLNPVLFGAAGLAAMAISSLHLGKKLKAYRALINWRHSWLSREIIFYALFLIIALIYAAIMPEIRIVGWIAVIAGFACLFSMDMVYQFIPRTEEQRGHSAFVLFMGLYLTGIF